MIDPLVDDVFQVVVSASMSCNRNLSAIQPPLKVVVVSIVTNEFNLIRRTLTIYQFDAAISRFHFFPQRICDFHALVLALAIELPEFGLKRVKF